MDINFGLKLKLLRERAGMTQDELASKLGYSGSSSIAKIESGAAGIPHWKLAKFAYVLGCKETDLISPEDNPIVQGALEIAQKEEEEKKQFESLQNILAMLSKMDAKQLVKVEKVIRTLSED